jgi:putative heme-binding domain-containing protein
LTALSDAMLDNAFVAIELSGLIDENGTTADASILAGLIARHQADPHALPVLLSAVNRSNLAGVIEKLTQPNPRWRSNGALPNLGRMAARWKDAASLHLLTTFLLNGTGPGESARLALLSGLFEGGAALDDLSADTITREKLRVFLDAIRSRVTDAETTPEDRAEATRFLGHPAVFAGEADLLILVGLLTPASSPALREAAFAALGRARHASTPKRLLERWAALAPADRTKALSLLLSRPDGASILLAAVEAGKPARTEIDATSRKLLLDAKDTSLRERAERLFASSTNESREEVLKAHADVVSLKGDPVTGKTVFGTVCIACHVAEGTGNPVGPDLTALTDRSTDSMLVAILDPNRAIEDKFLNYTVTTKNGDSLFGLIADESANSITIRQADGSARAVPRNEIAAMASTGVSLMPEGFEKILTKPQLADLIAYLGALGSAAPPAPKGNIDMAARISPGKGGIVELRASRCRLDGERIEYMPDYDAIGWWTSEEDRAQWTLVLDRPGKYRVEWEYSVSPEAAGNAWMIEIGGKEVLSGTVASTGSWETFKTETLGTIDLPAADNQVVVRSKGPVKGALLDLRMVRFVPVGN